MDGGLVGGSDRVGLGPELSEAGEGAVLFPEYVHLPGAKVVFFPATVGESSVERVFGRLAYSEHAILVGATCGAGHVGVGLGVHHLLLGVGETILEGACNVGVGGGELEVYRSRGGFLGLILGQE